jgi:hypothetical protein
MTRCARGLVALIAVVAIGCSGATAPDAPEAAEAGLLDFTAPAVGGGQVAGADYAGRDLALWFWAPW